MAIHQAFFDTSDHRSAGDQIWCELYSTLRPYILAWVYSSGVTSWHGQENDIADDILQEAIIRTLKYTKQAESGKNLPIHSITCFSRTVAQNHFRDLRRRELRLVRPTLHDNDEVPFFVSQSEQVDPSEVALEGLARRSLLLALARIIADFPDKQRTALLTDLANHADFADEQCPLRSAFVAVGIDLHAYRRPLPINPAERSRHAASLSMAYKRLKQTFSVSYRDHFV